MKKNTAGKLTIYIIISMLLVLMMNSCGIFTSLFNKNDNETETESETIPVNTEPVTVETTTPAPQLPIDPPVIVTQAPEPEPPVGGNAFSASGTINSESNQLLKLHIDWVAYQTADSEYADVKLSIFLECYAITVGARTSSTLTVNGEKKEFPTARISNENNSLTVLELYTEWITVHNPAGSEIKSADIEAAFYFGGSYGGESIGWIETKGVINFVDDGSPMPEPRPETEAETTTVEEVMEEPADEEIVDEIEQIIDEEIPETEENTNEEKNVETEEANDNELEPPLPDDPFAPIEGE